MCLGPEIIAFVQTAGAAIGALQGVKALMGGGGSPEVVAQNPAGDAAAATDKAGQEAAQKKLAQRRAARANSLLSEAGGMGDPSAVSTQSGAAGGKLTLGA